MILTFHNSDFNTMCTFSLFGPGHVPLKKVRDLLLSSMEEEAGCTI